MKIHKRNIDPKNCDFTLKEVVQIYGELHTLIGKYAYEWSIVTKRYDGTERVITFKNRKLARKEWEKIKNQK